MDPVSEYDYPVWYTIWKYMIQREDTDMISSILDKHWDMKSPDGWSLFEIFVRFERWDCLGLLLTKVPETYLDTMYHAERGFESYSIIIKIVLAHIRAEVLRRVLMDTNLPTDIIGAICGYSDVHI